VQLCFELSKINFVNIHHGIDIYHVLYTFIEY
jgi:hypothetical protein